MLDVQRRDFISLLGGRTVSSDFLSFSTTRSGVCFLKLPQETEMPNFRWGEMGSEYAVGRRCTFPSLLPASACVKFTSMCASACTGARTAFALDPDRRELAPTGRQTRISLTPCLIKERCAPIGHVCPLSVVWVSRLFGRLPGPTAGCR